MQPGELTSHFWKCWPFFSDVRHLFSRGTSEITLNLRGVKFGQVFCEETKSTDQDVGQNKSARPSQQATEAAVAVVAVVAATQTTSGSATAAPKPADRASEDPLARERPGMTQPTTPAEAADEAAGSTSPGGGTLYAFGWKPVAVGVAEGHWT